MSDTTTTGNAGPRYADEGGWDDTHGADAPQAPDRGRSSRAHDTGYVRDDGFAREAFDTSAYRDPHTPDPHAGETEGGDTFPEALRSRTGRQRRIHYDPGTARGEDAFRDAARHSRFVRALKFVLPTLAALAVLVFWAAARVVPGSFDDLVSVAGIDVESNSVVMDNPQISGFEGTRRAYLVKAANAVQSLDDPKVITFNEIDASLGLDEAGTATISATIGVFDGNTNSLTLAEGASLSTTEGYSARLTDAEINLGEGSLTSGKPLELGMADGTLRANGIRVEERGKRISFVDGVSLKFVPPDDLMATPAVEASQ